MAIDDRYPRQPVPASELAEPGAAPLALPWVEYPESDDQPMAESDIHRDEMIDLITALQDFLRDEPDVYVAGNLFIYYEQGNPRSVVAPDVFVVRGVAKRKRKTYRLWEEGRAPCFVIEVSSASTRDEDLEGKMQKYADLGVEEYVLFDPLGEYLDPRLRGFRLIDHRYREIRPAGDGSLLSRTLGLTLSIEGQRLRLRVTATGEPLLRVEEARSGQREAEGRAASEAAARRDAEDRAASEAAARRDAEQRLSALEAELARRSDPR